MSEPELGRGFVAVVPPDDVLDAVDAAATAIEVPSTARRTTRSQWHLTLQFLGNRVDFAAVAAALEPLAVRGSVVQLGAAGAFPSERRGRVLWLGVSEGGALLVNSSDFVLRAEIVREKGTNRSQFFRGQVDKYSWVDIGSSYLPGEIIAGRLR